MKIPFSIHKKILLHAISCVLQEPEEGSSFLLEYTQLKNFREQRDQDLDQFLEEFKGTPVSAYEYTNIELLYDEIMTWYDAILYGYQLNQKAH